MKMADSIKFILRQNEGRWNVEILFLNHLLDIENHERLGVPHDQESILVVNHDVLNIIFVFVFYDVVILPNFFNYCLRVFRIKKFDYVICLAKQD